MFKKIKQLLCKHDWEICKQQSPSGFASLRGEQLYRRCKKCGKVEEYIFREYEGPGYK